MFSLGRAESLLSRTQPEFGTNLELERNEQVHAKGAFSFSAIVLDRSGIDALQCETYTAPTAARIAQFGNVIDPNAGGKDGPIQISITNFIYPLVQNWIP